MADDGVKPETQSLERIEFGHKFRWNAETNNWETTAGREVLVRPPSKLSAYWYVSVPSTGTQLPFCGADAEKRAFCVAESYSRQVD